MRSRLLDGLSAVVDLHSSGRNSDYEYARKLCFGLAIRGMGASVWFCNPDRSHPLNKYASRSKRPRSAEVLICGSESRILAEEHRKFRFRIVADKSRCGPESKHVERADVLLSYALSSCDWAFPPPYPCSFPSSVAVKPKSMSVNYLVGFSSMLELDRLGLFDRYVHDDVGAVRSAITEELSEERVCVVGFCGRATKARREMAEDAGSLGADVRLLGPSSPALFSDADYLRFVASCGATLCFPGDLWKTSRMSEAWLLGSIAVCLRGTVRLSHALTEENAILLDDWGDEIGFRAGYAYTDKKRRAQDDSYLHHWSPAGQMVDAMSQAGVLAIEE